MHGIIIIIIISLFKNVSFLFLRGEEGWED